MLVIKLYGYNVFFEIIIEVFVNIWLIINNNNFLKH